MEAGDGEEAAREGARNLSGAGWEQARNLLAQLRAEKDARALAEPRARYCRNASRTEGQGTQLLVLPHSVRLIVFTPQVDEFAPNPMGIDLLFRAIPFERCPPRQKSRVERLKAKVEPLLT